MLARLTRPGRPNWLVSPPPWWGPTSSFTCCPLMAMAPFFGIGLLLPGISMKRKNTPGPLQSRHRRQTRTCLTSLPHDPQRPPALAYWPFQLSPEPPFTESPGELVNSQMAGIQFNLISEPGRSVRICLSREFPSNADAVGPRTTCGEQVCQRMPENARVVRISARHRQLSTILQNLPVLTPRCN